MKNYMSDKEIIEKFKPIFLEIKLNLLNTPGELYLGLSNYFLDFGDFLPDSTKDIIKNVFREILPGFITFRDLDYLYFSTDDDRLYEIFLKALLSAEGTKLE